MRNIGVALLVLTAFSSGLCSLYFFPTVMMFASEPGGGGMILLPLSGVVVCVVSIFLARRLARGGADHARPIDGARDDEDRGDGMN